jgi:uncharacterized protein (DUF2336 family)
MSPHERQMAGDILIGLLRSADIELRISCAKRLANIVDAPKVVLRYLARDVIAVAAPLLETGPGLDDSDLIASIRAGTAAHREVIARRRNLSETVIHTGDPKAIECLLRNAFSKLSATGVDMIVAQSREHRSLVPALLARDELKPQQGLTLFWWAEAEARVHILRRFAVDRAVLLQEVTDLFAMSTTENWTDREARIALQFIERRQRSRVAATRSKHGSLEGAIQSLRTDGPRHDTVIELTHLAGVRPAVGARILADPGGEPIAVLAKAVGLKRDFLHMLWEALERKIDDDPKSSFGRMIYVYETLATAKAQTVLRYWNWAFTADVVLDTEPDEDAALEFAPARRTAMLVSGRRVGGFGENPPPTPAFAAPKPEKPVRAPRAAKAETKVT